VPGALHTVRRARDEVTAQLHGPDYRDD